MCVTVAKDLTIQTDLLRLKALIMESTYRLRELAIRVSILITCFDQVVLKTIIRLVICIASRGHSIQTVKP